MPAATGAPFLYLGERPVGLGSLNVFESGGGQVGPVFSDRDSDGCALIF
jgi:hypothetical protein